MEVGTNLRKNRSFGLIIVLSVALVCLLWVTPVSAQAGKEGGRGISKGPIDESFTIEAMAGAFGSISPEGDVTVLEGDDQAFEITPDEGGQIDSVVVDGVNVGPVADYTFYSVDANHQIRAYFSLTSFTITATAHEGGSITPSGAVRVVYGAQQEFFISPSTGYHLDRVLVDGINVGSVTTYAFESVSANHTIDAYFMLNSYTIIATNSAGGSISPSGSVAVLHGGSQSFTLTPSLHHHLDSLVVDGTNLGAQTSYTFSNVSTHHVIAGFFSIDRFTISASVAGSGSITPSGEVSVAYGSSQIFSMVPSAGYHLDSLLVDGANAGTPASYTFSDIAASHAITAFFSINRYVITAGAGAGGSISPVGSVTVLHGGNQSFAMTPDPGYHIDSVVVDGQSAGQVPVYTFSGVASDHSIEAYYSINLFTITATAGPHGSISPSGVVTLPFGSSQVLSVTPSTGYHIDRVTVDGVNQGPVPSYTFTNITSSHTIDASFAIDVHTISAVSSDGGSITPSGSVQVNHGSDQLFTFSPDPGHHLDSLLVDGFNMGTPGTYSFANVTAAHEITAYFSINHYTVTVTAGPGGSVMPSGLIPVSYGDELSFDFVPDAGYHVDSVVVDGVNQGALPGLVLSAISASHVINAYFTIDSFTIVATSGSGGAITPSGPVAVQFGGSQAFTFTSEPGYHVVSVVVDGVPQGTPAGYTFSDVEADHSIEVYFAINGYVITASAGPGGSIDPSGVVPVSHGDSEIFTMEPDEGHHLDSVLVDGMNAGAIDSYTFEDITLSHTISAYFSPDLFTITASAGPGGSITPSGDVLVPFGGSRTFTILAATGHHVDSVLADGVNQGPLGSYTFAAIGEDHSIEAYFSPDIVIITASAGAGGSISPSGNVPVEYGSSEVFDITPDDGYHVIRVVVDGSSVGAPLSYTFDEVTVPHTIIALFTQDSIVVTATASAGGSITPSGSIPVVLGGTQLFTISAYPGFHIDSVLVDGSDEGVIETYEFREVDRDGSIAAYFSEDLNGIPSLESLSPEECTVGEGPLVLDISGEGFVPGSVVRFNGQGLATTFEDSTSLTVTLGPGETDTAGYFSVEVFNPAPGGGLSGTKIFAVQRQREGVGSVAGRVYVDVNGSGQNEAGDVPQPGWSVSLLADGDEVDSYSTGVDGMFAFDSLDEGSYEVQIEVEEGWELTQPAPTGRYGVVIDSVNRVFTTFDFGTFELGSISGSAYRDVNGNASMDPDEIGMPGVRIEATSGPLVYSTITDEEGEFTFTDVVHGSYQVREVIPSQYVCLQGRTGYAVSLTSGAAVTSLIFGNASSWDTVKFRTVTMDEWTEAVDAKGKLKSIRRKSDKVEFTFPVVSDGSGMLTLDFNMPVEGEVCLDQDGNLPVQSIEGKKISGLTVQAPAGDTIWVKGFGLRGKSLKASYAWGRMRKSAVSGYAVNVLRYPLPNWHNVGEELFKRKAFGAGLSVGATVFANGGGTVVHRNYRDVLKSLTNRGEVHSGPAKCLDFYDNGKVIPSRLRSLPWDKQDNELFAQQLMLKLNIAASDNHYFQPGFGDLLYDNSATDTEDPFNYQSIRFIASRVDSFLGCLLPRNGIPGDVFLDVVSSINDAFSGELDTISFASELMITGTRSLAQSQMFSPSPGPIPVYTPPAPFIVAPVPTAYRLHQNYPNPFNPSTTIGFELPDPSTVTLRIYNIIGQEVAVVLDREEMDEGLQELDFDASALPSGVYFYRLEATPLTDEDGTGPAHMIVDSRKMLLVK